MSAFLKDEHNAKTAPSHRKDERFFKRRAHYQDSAVASQKDEHTAKTPSSHRKDERFFKRRAQCQAV
jgi:hypothetical protein